jgi:hypothetical protein
MKRPRIFVRRDKYPNPVEEAYPLTVPFTRSASSSAAMLRASGLSSVTMCNVEFISLILATYALTLLAGFIVTF